MNSPTGYNIREGSDELARRRAARVREVDRAVAAAMLRRSRIARLAQIALDILATPTPGGGVSRKPW